MPAWTAPRLAPPESTNAVVGSALVANAPTPAAGARRLGGDLVAGAREHIPTGAEGVHALAVGVAGALVAREGVERVAVVGHLGLAVGARAGAHERDARPAADRGLAARAQGRPGARAGAGARALGPRVLFEQVEGVALRVGEDLAQAAALEPEGCRAPAGRLRRAARGGGAVAAAATARDRQGGERDHCGAGQEGDGSASRHGRSFEGVH